jgi:hypothetical protein
MALRLSCDRPVRAGHRRVRLAKAGQHCCTAVLARAISTAKIMPSEVVTDLAPIYPVVLEELLPTVWHRTDRYANNRIEADHGRLKARLRPMCGLRQEHGARVVIRRTRLRPERSARALRAGSRGAGEPTVGSRLRRACLGDLTASPRSRLQHARSHQTQHGRSGSRPNPPATRWRCGGNCAAPGRCRSASRPGWSRPRQHSPTGSAAPSTWSGPAAGKPWCWTGDGHQPADQQRLAAVYTAAREAEWTEFLSECGKFLTELDKEIATLSSPWPSWTRRSRAWSACVAGTGNCGCVTCSEPPQPSVPTPVLTPQKVGFGDRFLTR